jgi:hypothetical protein
MIRIVWIIHISPAEKIKKRIPRVSRIPVDHHRYEIVRIIVKGHDPYVYNSQYKLETICSNKPTIKKYNKPFRRMPPAERFPTALQTESPMLNLLNQLHYFK